MAVFSMPSFIAMASAVLKPMPRMSRAVNDAQRREGGGLCHNYFAHENNPIYRVRILHVTRYQLMIWMVASGRLILPDGRSRCDRDWFAVTRDARRATPLHLQRSATETRHAVLATRCVLSGHRR